MSRQKVLIVDDEQAIRKFLKVALSAQGYEVIEAASGNEALSSAAAQKPEIITLDLGLPDLDGVEVVKLLRQWSQTPIIILSIRGAEKDKIAALDAGADDYLTKPFGVGELLARIRAGLRRAAQTPGQESINTGDLQIDFVRRIVTVSDHEIQLTPNEYAILKALINRSGRVLTHRQILQEVWGEQYGDELHMLHVNISNLRKKIEPDSTRPRYIITEPGVGYRFRVEQDK
jgi:two-component system, OmpR family, KDP operon response regulator KdpE